jgi:hypothetical protein
LGDRLGNSVVVFVGLGDVASYVRIRIEQLLEAIGHLHEVWVASTSLSQVWQELVPGVAERFIQVSGDAFLDQLLCDYVRIALEGLKARAREHGELGTYSAFDFDVAAGAETFSELVASSDALSVMLWLRRSAHEWPVGEPVLHAAAGRAVLLALAVASAKREPTCVEGTLRFGGDPVELVLLKSQPAAVAVDEAVSRIAAALNDGRVKMAETVAVLCHGHEGPLPQTELKHAIPLGGSSDIIDGQMTPSLRFLSVQRIIEAEFPEEWAA